MISKLFSDISFTKKQLDVADIVSYSRPKAIREYDQIYMKSSDMLLQAELVAPYLEGKKIVFLGDGDGMSILIGLLSLEKKLNIPSNILVLDFDSRILSNVRNIYNGMNNNHINISTHLYNVLDPTPEKNHQESDFFYINPPYGSKNAGKSAILWIERCMELCTDNCCGCIIVPYDAKISWTIDAMFNIQTFLLEKGFVIIDLISGLHSYHLLDNPNLLSTTIIVQRIKYINPSFKGKILTSSETNFLYGSTILLD